MKYNNWINCGPLTWKAPDAILESIAATEASRGCDDEFRDGGQGHRRCYEGQSAHRALSQRLWNCRPWSNGGHDRFTYAQNCNQGHFPKRFFKQLEPPILVKNLHNLNDPLRFLSRKPSKIDPHAIIYTNIVWKIWTYIHHFYVV